MKNKRIALMGAALVLALSLAALTGCSSSASSASPSAAAPAPASSQASSAGSMAAPASTVDAKSMQPVSASGEMAGAYTEQRELTAEDKALFEEVMAKQENGKTYEAVSVATQVVAGTNYRFAVKVTQDGKTSDAFVVIFQPLPGQGDAEFVAEEC